MKKMLRRWMQFGMSIVVLALGLLVRSTPAHVAALLEIARPEVALKVLLPLRSPVAVTI